MPLAEITYTGKRPASNNHAGNKTRVDVDVLLQGRYGNPYEDLEDIAFTGSRHKISCLLSISHLRQIWRIREIRSKNLIVQYPFYFNRFRLGS